MVIKIAAHTFIGKSLDKFSSGFFESGIHYVPMGMAQGRVDRKNNECAI